MESNRTLRLRRQTDGRHHRHRWRLTLGTASDRHPEENPYREIPTCHLRHSTSGECHPRAVKQKQPPRNTVGFAEQCTPEKDTEADRRAQQEEIERQKAEAARRAQEEEAERAAEAQRIAQEKAEQEAAIRREEEERQEAIRKAKAEEEKRRKRENSLLGRLQKWATDILNEEE